MLADLATKGVDWSRRIKRGGTRLTRRLRHWARELRRPEPVLTGTQREMWAEDGYLVLEGFVPPWECRALRDAIDDAWTLRHREGYPLVADVYLGQPREARIRLADAPDDARRHPYKLNNHFLINNTVRRAALDARLMAVIRELLGGDPLLFNLLTLEHGSQQGDHCDTFFMPPKVENKLVAAWFALEDIHPDAGPLRYHPGSHLIPPYRFSDGRLHVTPAEIPAFEAYIKPELAKRGIEPRTFLPRAGDVFLWHAQLLHGGEPIRDPERTRTSMVAHYFRAKDLPEVRQATHAPGRFYLPDCHPAPRPRPPAG